MRRINHIRNTTIHLILHPNFELALAALCATVIIVQLIKTDDPTNTVITACAGGLLYANIVKWNKRR